MEDFCKYLAINKTVSLICCMFWIFSAAEGNSISTVVGSKVILRCKNRTNDTLTQLTWKMNNVRLLTFKPVRLLDESQKARSLKINISLSGSEMYALVIERAEKSHTGNYTCEINTDKGSGEQKWELIIKEHEESGNLNKLLIVVAVTVPCVCCLIFVIAFAILRRVCKRAGGRSRSAEMVNIKISILSFKKLQLLNSLKIYNDLSFTACEVKTICYN
uniref:uncharacterized protein LOC117251771 isoform X1 n=1 Tax=Epinephelus lanceolatus TaxID=310571 RepID=UPI00144792AB|nr:uncharacterized protein LOC117251771 isoform X1 [Epinephelus lanceolatus]